MSLKSSFVSPPPLDSFIVKVGVQEPLNISDYATNADPLPYIAIASVIMIPIIVFFSFEVFEDTRVGKAKPSNLMLLFAACILYPIMIMFCFVQPAEIFSQEGNTMPPAIDRSVSDTEFNKAVNKAFTDQGWGADCTNSKDSIVCGGSDMGVPVPAYNNDGEQATIVLRIPDKQFLDDNGVTKDNKDSRVINPGEQLVFPIEVVDAK